LPLLRCSPIFHFCCSPIFHFCYSPAFQAIRFSLRSYCPRRSDDRLLLRPSIRRGASTRRPVAATAVVSIAVVAALTCTATFPTSPAGVSPIIASSSLRNAAHRHRVDHRLAGR
jgi:hypothetical protein